MALTAASWCLKPVSTDAIFNELEAALNRCGQVILCGPPGTGKTYYAKRAAVWLLEGGSDSEHANAMLADEQLLETQERKLASNPSDPTKAARLTRVTFRPLTPTRTSSRASGLGKRTPACNSP